MKVFGKTKKSLYKTLFLMTSALFVVAFVSCKQPTGPEQSSEQPTEEDSGKAPEKKPEPPVDNNIFLGTWAWDYGYNQDNFSEERLTLNKDNTFIIQAKFPNGYTEDDKGIYEIVTDSTYGKTLRLHITSWKDNTMQNFDSADVLLSYKCYFDGEDTMHLDRFKKDFSRQDGPVYDFDPPVRNIYYRVKDGTKDNLAGKWHVNKHGIPDCDWDETWTFNTDGTMVDDWTEAGQSPETYNGTYEVTQKDGKNMLHQILDWGTEKPEWWYEYKSYGPNVISVQMVESTSEGKVSDAPINYYYRYIETETFTYHFANYTLHQTVPKASSYTLTNHPYQLNDYPSFFVGYEIDFLGWYNNPECTGNEVKTVTDNKREFWAKTSITIKADELHQSGDGYYGNDDVPVMAVTGITDVSKVNAKKGEQINVYFEATLSQDFEGPMGLDIMDSYATDDPNHFWANSWPTVKSKNKRISTIFTFNIDKDTHFENINDVWFLLAYRTPVKDLELKFTDYKFVILDEANSYNITYKWGDVGFKSRGYKEIDFALPENAAFFDNFDWRLAQQELLGWYDNPEFTGTPVTSIPKGNTSDKTYYAKFNFKGRYCEWEENGVKQHDYHTTVPVRTLLSETEFNPKPGDTYNILFEATLSHDFNQWAGLQLQTDDNQNFQDFGNLETQNKKLSKVFTIKIPDNVKLPSVDELYFDFWYSDEACDEIVTFSDWKFEVIE